MQKKNLLYINFKYNQSYTCKDRKLKIMKNITLNYLSEEK